MGLIARLSARWRLMRATHEAAILTIAELRGLREEVARLRERLVYCRTCGVVLYDPHPAVDREELAGEITTRCAPCGALRRFRMLDLDRRDN